MKAGPGGGQVAGPLARMKIVISSGEDTLLDARGDLVLLRRLVELGVPRAVVSRLRAAPDWLNRG